MTFPEKRIDWLYEHFQGITKRSDQLLVLFSILFVCALAVTVSTADPIELPFLKVNAGRQVLLGSVILFAVFTLIAFFGNYDYGERALDSLASALGCDYSDLWFADTHPTLIDFAQFRSPTVTKKRGLLARFTASLLYPLIIISALAWLSAIWAWECWSRTMTIFEAVPYFLILPALYVAWDRGVEYLRRRWLSFLAGEKSRRSELESRSVAQDSPADMQTANQPPV